MKSALTFALVFAAVLPSALWGQAKCDALHPLPNSSFQYKDRGNRCEGIYVADIGTTSLELVSFQHGSMAAQFTPGEVLKVSVPGQAGPVHVRAVAIPARTYYRMDAVLSPGASLRWPVDDVLLPEHLNANRLGIFAWKDDEQNKIFLPVHIESSRRGAAAAVPFLTVRPSFDVEKVRWRSAPLRNQRCVAAGLWRNVNQVSAGEPIKLSLSGLQGQYCINVTAQAESGNEWTPPIQIRVEIPTE